jgi:hypothetical protein
MKKEAKLVTSPNIPRSPITPPVKASKIIASDWKPMQKGESLQGFISLELPSGIKLFECTYYRRRTDGRRWVGLPARSYETSAGEKKWFRLVDIADKEVYKRFQAAALAAIDEMLGAAE